MGGEIWGGGNNNPRYGGENSGMIAEIPTVRRDKRREILRLKGKDILTIHGDTGLISGQDLVAVTYHGPNEEENNGLVVEDIKRSRSEMTELTGLGNTVSPPKNDKIDMV